MKHISGPWNIADGLTIEGDSCLCIYSTPYRQIAHVPDYDAKGEANARLVAAAPDLLEALEGLLDGAITYAPDYMHGVSKKEYIDKAKAAINKAKGA